MRSGATTYGRIMPANSSAAIRQCSSANSVRANHAGEFIRPYRPYRMYSRSLLRLSAACNPLQQFCHHAVQYRRCRQLHRITTP